MTHDSGTNPNGQFCNEACFCDHGTLERDGTDDAGQACGARFEVLMVHRATFEEAYR